jgi:hypothetical protein
MERKPKTPQRKRRGRTGAEPAPIAVDDDRANAPSHDRTEALADARLQSSHAVYCDSEQEVLTGFAIALRAMGLR